MAKGSKKKKSVLLGIALDSDGHKRITTGADFALLGGTEESHNALTEKTIKIKEKLFSRGKTLETVSAEEFKDIAQSVGLKEMKPKENQD